MIYIIFRRPFSHRVPQNSVTYAGTKDRRAVTTQWMSIRRGDANKLLSLKLNKLRFGNFEFRDKPLSLGDLKGNRFVIALRYVNKFFLTNKGRKLRIHIIHSHVK